MAPKSGLSIISFSLLGCYRREFTHFQSILFIGEGNAIPKEDPLKGAVIVSMKRRETSITPQRPCAGNKPLSRDSGERWTSGRVGVHAQLFLDAALLHEPFQRSFRKLSQSSCRTNLTNRNQSSKGYKSNQFGSQYFRSVLRVSQKEIASIIFKKRLKKSIRTLPFKIHWAFLTCV